MGTYLFEDRYGVSEPTPVEKKYAVVFVNVPHSRAESNGVPQGCLRLHVTSQLHKTRQKRQVRTRQNKTGHFLSVHFRVVSTHSEMSTQDRVGQDGTRQDRTR